jgi:fructose-bisphosphate aldolase class 1
MTTSQVILTTMSAVHAAKRRVLAAANALVAGDKSLLAIDESIPTCNKRFARLGIAQTEHNRRAYGRAIQQPALNIWDGRHTNAGRAQHAIVQRAKANRDARRGEYRHTAIPARA